jgi:hypothetical protein
MVDDIGPDYIDKIENRKKRPSYQMVLMLAIALRFKLEDVQEALELLDYPRLRKRHRPWKKYSQ